MKIYLVEACEEYEVPWLMSAFISKEQAREYQDELNRTATEDPDNDMFGGWVSYCITEIDVTE
jgi:hypothetical protein